MAREAKGVSFKLREAVLKGTAFLTFFLQRKPNEWKILKSISLIVSTGLLPMNDSKTAMVSVNIQTKKQISDPAF
jgi:hypothetical protein